MPKKRSRFPRKKNEIVALQEESTQQQEAVEELVQATYNQIREYQEELQGAQSPGEQPVVPDR